MNAPSINYDAGNGGGDAAGFDDLEARLNNLKKL